MASRGVRAALGAALLIAGTGLAVVGAMAMRSTDGLPVAAPSLDALAGAVTAQPGEIAGLGEALHEHLPPDAIVLAWEDVSRQLHLPEETPASFGWTDALLAPRAEGIRQLRAHAGERTVHLVVHIRDTLLLGALEPDRLGVAFRDLADSGNMHGSINGARDWVRSEGFAAYTAYRLDDSRLRLVALTDDASMETLLAQLLPFHDPRRQREPVPGLTLVHQVGGFWVYRLEPAQG